MIGERHEWKGYIAVRARYSSPVKYWLIHASDDEKAYELMNDQVVRVNEMLLNRENMDEAQIERFATADLEAHHLATSLELEDAIHACVASAPDGQMTFGALRKQLASRFFGRVRWVGGYGSAIRGLCTAKKLEREAPRLAAKFETDEMIRAVESAPGPGAQVVPIRRSA